jgi:cytochrome P450
MPPAEVEYNPYAYQIHEDPYPTYAALRAHAPIYRNDALDFWALSRHADVLAAFKDTERFSNDHGVSLDPESWGPQATAGTSFLALDPPNTAARALVSKGFTPRRVAALEQSIRALTTAYLDPLVGAGRFDFIDELAGRVPMDVISEMLGVPRADRAELRRRADLLVHREEGHTGVPPEGVAAFAWIRSYFRAMIAARRARPGDDLLSLLLEVEAEGERLDESEILSFANLMIVAGNETTTRCSRTRSTGCGGIRAARAVREDPVARFPTGSRETLRFDNSTQMLARRIARDVAAPGARCARAARPARGLREPRRARVRARERVRPRPRRRRASRSGAACTSASARRSRGSRAASCSEEWWRRFPDYEIEPAGAVRVHSINVRGFAALLWRL